MDTWIIKLLHDYKKRRAENMSQSWFKNRNINSRFALKRKKRNEAYIAMATMDVLFAKDTISWIKERISEDNIELVKLKTGLYYLEAHGMRLEGWKGHLILAGAFIGILTAHAMNTSSMAAAGVIAASSILGLLFAAERLEMHSQSSDIKELVACMEFIISETAPDKIDKGN